mgnify:CR=1 FL=1
MNYFFPRLVRFLPVLLVAAVLMGCELKAKPIDIGPPAQRPRMGLQLKVVEGAQYMEEPFWDEYEHALLVMGIKPGTPAAASAIREGDLLLKIDGQAVHGMRDSTFIMSRKHPDDTVLLNIYRDGETQQIGIDLNPARSGHAD